MSVVTSKSTMLSILKTPNGTPRGSSHRVRFKLPNNIKKIFLDLKSGCNVKDYESLVCTIRDSDINDCDLLALLVEARNCTSLLNYDLRLFVQALIMVKWTHRDETVVKCYQEFISDLVSAHACHTKLVIDQLVKLFLNVEETDWVDDRLSDVLLKQLNNVHILLQTTVTTIPMSEGLLMEAIKHNFPYVNATMPKQISYFYNLLKLIQYQPELRVDILQIIIDKMILLDVQSPREEILQYEKNSEDLLYEMEVDTIKETNNLYHRHPVANTLDLAMDLIFQFIQSECYVDGKLNQCKCHQLYNDLMIVFESVILPTHACHHVQYIIFYICSFHSSIAHDFLKFLWRKMVSPSIPPVIRQISVAYLSSFLARANYLQLGYLKTYLSKLSHWIHKYIAQHNSVPEFQPDYKKHSVFYSICQGLFYLIAFRHQDLVNSTIKLVFLQSLNLPKIISCKFNPLKFCLPSVVENFAAVTRALQLAYCYTIIENNSRGSIPIVGSAGQLIINSVIETYFPFDFYVLLRTSEYVRPLHREYRSLLCEDGVRINEKKRRLYSGTEDEDDFIGEEILDHMSSEKN